MPEYSNHIERAYAILNRTCDVQTECAVLLASVEPLGLPGCFFYSDSYGEKFNRWKASHSEGRHYWNHYYRELETIDAHPEVLHYAFGTDNPRYLYRWRREALRLPVPTTICIEALVSAGYADHSRVRRAINTLIEFRHNPWEKDFECSCPMAKAELYIEDRDSAPDFDRAEVLPIRKVDYFYAPLVRRALLRHPGFHGSVLDMNTRGKDLHTWE